MTNVKRCPGPSRWFCFGCTGEVFNTCDFHQRFAPAGRKVPPAVPTPMEKLPLRKRVDLLNEEFCEFVRGVAESDFVGQVDALIDMVYVIKGIAVAMGVGPCWDVLWDAVHASNMKKEWREDLASEGSYKPIRKPEGWVPPDIEGILRRYGWDGKKGGDK